MSGINVQTFVDQQVTVKSHSTGHLGRIDVSCFCQANMIEVKALQCKSIKTCFDETEPIVYTQYSWKIAHFK